MEWLKGIQQLNKALVRPVITIGNFDGVHLGHQQIIQLAIQKAKEVQGTSVAFTFRPHPQIALKPETAPPLITTYDEKIELLQETGLNLVIEEPFSREFSTVAPEQFFTEILLRRLSAQEIVVGYDFAFGKGREGHLDVLISLCKKSGITLTIVEPQKVNGEVVSSSRIRNHLAQGNLPAANSLLGRNFFYRGVVLRGDQRGRTIGFPTANLKLEGKFTLPFGVYATSSRLVDGAVAGQPRDYVSVTNIGIRPTFQKGAGDLASPPPAIIETHLLDTTVDLYGRSIEVQFLAKLRNERKFSGIDALKAQIALDIECVRNALAVLNKSARAVK